MELDASGALAADGNTIHDGYVYVTDSYTGMLLRVAVGTVDGAFEGVVGGMVSPTDVAVTAGGRMFVTASTSGGHGTGAQLRGAMTRT